MRNIKKFVSLFLATIIATLSLNIGVKAEVKEMRGAWIPTVWNIAWPSSSSKGNQTRQKQEMISMLDRLKATGINNVFFQVRDEGDALYRSNINPWSRFLTGTQGRDPGYDPLEFMITEAHKRGIKVHAWMNPYRAWTSKTKDGLSPSSQVSKHPEWIAFYDNRYYFQPGLPEVKSYILDTVKEVLDNYDVDGIHFDDYFYPGGNFPDDSVYNKYGSGNKAAWRRSVVNDMVKSVYQLVKSTKPSVEFGVSPGGIWRNKSSDPNGSNTNGNEAYSSQNADSLAWIRGGYIDYIAPQIYWTFENKRAGYQTLVDWWSNQLRGSKVKLYIGHDIEKYGQSSYGGENVAAQIKRQLDYANSKSEVDGSIFYEATQILNIPQVANDLKKVYFPQDSNYRLPYQASLMGADRSDTAIAVSKKSWTSTTPTVVLMNGNDTVAGVSTSPLASALNAPILLKFAGKVSDNTLNEIKRLNPSKIIVVGDENSISDSDVERVKKASNADIERLEADNVENLSRVIADKLKTIQAPKRVYIASKEALVDVLSIASKAGNERNPIIITGSDSIDDSSLEWIKSNVGEAYIIGGPDTVSTSVESKIKNTGISVNRIYGNDRIETNSKVIQTMYSDTFSPKAFTTRSDAPIDAITVSVFAQKSNSPIILVGKNVSSYQSSVLSPRSTSLLYKVGGGINQSSYTKIYNLLEGQMK